MRKKNNLKAQREFAELSESDKQWQLCRSTGYSYIELLGYAAQARGRYRLFFKSIGRTMHSVNADGTVADGNWWSIICAWLRLYVPQWEREFKQVTNKLATYPELEQQRILEVAAKALNIDEAVLVHFATHQQEIETFLEGMRSTLGTLAEAKLWELVMQGDPATIRWLLPRVKSDVFGDKLKDVQSDEVRTIRIIEVSD